MSDLRALRQRDSVKREKSADIQLVIDKAVPQTTVFNLLLFLSYVL